MPLAGDGAAARARTKAPLFEFELGHGSRLHACMGMHKQTRRKVATEAGQAQAEAASRWHRRRQHMRTVQILQTKTNAKASLKVKPNSIRTQNETARQASPAERTRSLSRAHLPLHAKPSLRDAQPTSTNRARQPAASPPSPRPGLLVRDGDEARWQAQARKRHTTVTPSTHSLMTNQRDELN
jgi:hypothetical protein